MHVFCDDVCAFVEIDAENRAAERLHGQPAAFDVEVDGAAVAPTNDERFRGTRHLAAEIRTLCFVKTGCSARLRGSHDKVGRTNRLSPAMLRTSSWMMHRSDNASVRPNTSRMPSGEVTATIGRRLAYVVHKYSR